MTVVAVTGHRALDDGAGMRELIDRELSRLDPPLVGISALAAGADQIFAAAVLAAGGRLDVIVPGRNYRESLDESARTAFDRFVAAASSVTVLDHDRVGSVAYLDAGLEMLERCDVLLAVWDGEPSRGAGGTADLVRRARATGVPVHIIAADRA